MKKVYLAGQSNEHDNNWKELFKNKLPTNGTLKLNTSRHNKYNSIHVTTTNINIPNIKSNTIDSNYIATSSSYTWTGNHSFSSTFNATGTTLIKNLNASSTVANPMVLNGLSYSMPAEHGASSTVLATNGAGALS